MKKILIAISMITIALASSAGEAGKGFQKISFEDALTTAKKENKLIFIDWYTTWCGPCKKMDRTTFKDENVVSWLSENAIAVKIDAEAQVDLAKKFQVQGYPTLMWLKSDGSVADRVVGYRDANEFIELSNNVKAGKNTVSLAEEKATSENATTKDKIAYAQALASSGEKDKAFQIYKDLVEQLISSPDPIDQPNFVFLMMSRLKTDEATAYLQKKAEEYRPKILAGDYSHETLGAFSNANRGSKNGAALLEIYDELRAKGKTALELRNFNGRIFTALKQQKRYKEIVDIQPISDRIATVKSSMESMLKRRPEAAEMAHSIFQSNMFDFYEILLGLDQTEEAAEVAKTLLEGEPNQDIYNGLAWSAYEADKCSAESLAYAKKANDMSEGKNASILDTYARVMFRCGQKQSAVTLLEDARAVVSEGREKKIIEEALAELTKALKDDAKI